MVFLRAEKGYVMFLATAERECLANEGFHLTYNARISSTISFKVITTLINVFSSHRGSAQRGLHQGPPFPTPS